MGWRLLGEYLGEAYQVADDLRDVACRQEEIGKPVGRDVTLGRPNAAALLGMDGALRRLSDLAHEAMEVIPDCPASRRCGRRSWPRTGVPAGAAGQSLVA